MYEVSQEIAAAFFFLYLKDTGHNPGVSWPCTSPGGWLGLWLCYWLKGWCWSLVQMCASLSANHDKNKKNIRLNKNKSTLSCHLSRTNDDL